MHALSCNGYHLDPVVAVVVVVVVVVVVAMPPVVVISGVRIWVRVISGSE